MTETMRTVAHEWRQPLNIISLEAQGLAFELDFTDDFDKMDGFLLYYSNDHFFGSQWKDHPIIIRSFVPVESAENKNENTEKTVPPEPSPETETLSETEASPTTSLSEYIEAHQLEKDAKEK